MDIITLLKELLFWRLPSNNSITTGPDHVLTFIAIGIIMMLALVHYIKVKRSIIVSVVSAFVDGMIIAVLGVWLFLFVTCGSAFSTGVSFPVIHNIPLVVLFLIAVGIRFLYLSDDSMLWRIGLYIVLQLPAFIFWRYVLHAAIDFVGSVHTQYWMTPWVVLWEVGLWSVTSAGYYFLVARPVKKRLKQE